MTEPVEGLQRLREVFQSRRAPAPAPLCPPADRTWEAARASTPLREMEAVVEHTASCPACAAAWRLARELAPQAEGRALARRTWRPAGILAVAAAALLAVGVGLRTSTWRSATSEYRRSAPLRIESLVPKEAALRRAACVLRWRSGLAGARFSLHVTDEDLNVLASPRDLATEAFAVPAEALASLPPGAGILWRVEALSQDGRKLGSPTFVHRLE